MLNKQFSQAELEQSICRDHELYDYIPKHITTVDDKLYQYIQAVSVREPEVLKQLREETAQQKHAIMQISPDQGQYMSLLVQLLSARRIIEIGTFTGYSSLAMALAMPDDGQLIACDVSDEWTQIARKYWQKAGVSHKIDLRIAPALYTLQQLIDEALSNTFDMVFIDADKANQEAYYEKALTLVRPGGLIAIDNVLWFGAVADETKQDADTQAIRGTNLKIRNDKRVDISLVPIGDGVLLARKR